ncbi:MAG: ASKHA domain-containing protein [Gaiellales bacterium]
MHGCLRLPEPASRPGRGRSQGVRRRRPDRLPKRLGDRLIASPPTLFDEADARDLRVPTSCRRSGRCRECVVEVTRGLDHLGPRTEAERFLRDPFRLACQAQIADGHADVHFEILRRRLRILTPPPERVDPADLHPLATVHDGAVSYGDDPLGPYRGALLGLAVDLGTTTIVTEVVDLETGDAVAVVAIENPQRFGGSDVMSRISYDTGPDHGELRRAVRKAVNAELEQLYRRRELDRRAVVEAVVVGNSTMRDLFFALDVTSIGERPYRSLTEHALRAGERETTAVETRAYELGIRMHPQGRVVGPPLLASHVGSDMAADLVALGVDPDGDEVVMVVDIGTNTEVTVAADGRLVTASCPAGPAFEGGLVSWAMQGAEGAIERARRLPDGSFDLQVIGGGEPEGICGSGLIDVLAELRRTDEMTPLGVFAGKAREVTVDPRRGITLSRADASQLAQAKAANTAGQWIVLRSLGLEPADVDRLFLVGGFANHVDVDNAVAIGFLPPIPRERVTKAGNASVRGARRLLLDTRARRRLEELVRRVEHVELETTPDFFDIFVEGCQFKPMPARLTNP